MANSIPELSRLVLKSRGLYIDLQQVQNGGSYEVVNHRTTSLCNALQQVQNAGLRCMQNPNYQYYQYACFAHEAIIYAGGTRLRDGPQNLLAK